MNAKMKYKMRTIFVQATKIMLGSSMAMFLAMLLGLENGNSAGIVALLTLVTTKLETLRLSLYRIITYVCTVLVSILIFQSIDSIWVAYGVFIFIVVLCSEYVGWKATISVNAVIGTHFLTSQDFSVAFILNEFMLVLIGISTAIILNFFSRNSYDEDVLIHNMKYTEKKLQEILSELSQYLRCEQMDRDVWVDTRDLEEKLEHFIEQACEYGNNTFKKDGNYYEKYFEMRLMQLSILHNLHYELKKMRSMPSEAKIISNFMLEIKEHVVDLENPREEILKLERTFGDILTHEMPKNIEELEGRAKLYHILMDLEEFLMHKMRFVELVSATTRYKKDYHNVEKIENEKVDMKNQQKKVIKKKEIIEV